MRIAGGGTAPVRQTLTTARDTDLVQLDEADIETVAQRYEEGGDEAAFGHFVTELSRFSADLANALAEHARTSSLGEICDHVFLYRGNDYLLYWHDAFDWSAGLAPDLSRERVEAFARALGCEGVLVREPDELRPALEGAFESGKPTLVNVLTDPEVVYPRKSNLA